MYVPNPHPPGFPLPNLLVPTHPPKLTPLSPRNLVTIATYLTLELLLLLVGTSYFAAADGHAATSVALKQAGGACGFVSGLTGFYTVGSAFFEEMLGWHWPMGDVRWLERGRRTRGRGV